MSSFSTWIFVQAASLQLIPHHFWRAQAGEEPVEGAGVPSDQHKVLSSAPAEDSLDLLLGFVGSFLLLGNTVQDKTVTV